MEKELERRGCGKRGREEGKKGNEREREGGSQKKPFDNSTLLMKFSEIYKSYSLPGKPLTPKPRTANTAPAVASFIFSSAESFNLEVVTYKISKFLPPKTREVMYVTGISICSKS